MRELNERPVCHRAEDLVTYLYGEAGDSDARDFREHLRQCDACRNEFAVFNQMHESIVLWRDEALGASFSPAAVLAEPAADPNQFVRQGRKLPALAALREFFNVSPLWLRGATAFAGLLLCVLAGLTIYRVFESPAPVVNNSGEARFTQADLDKAVAEARNDAIKQQQASLPKPKETVDQTPAPRTAKNTRPPGKSRIKGLTLEEREQLAADLRLIPATDEDELPFVISDQPY